MAIKIPLLSVTGITSGGDLSATSATYATGTFTLSPTVTGIQGHGITLAAGFLKYTGSAWAFDATTYVSAISLTGAVTGTYSGGTITTAYGAIAANSLMANVTGSAAVPTAIGVSSTATASAVMLRDANANTQINNIIEGYTTTATTASTLTLTIGSTYQQYFTGSTVSQVVKLPVTTTLVLGHQFQFTNNATVSVAVQAGNAGAINTLAAGTSAIYTCINNGTDGAASWSYALGGIAAAGSGTTNAIIKWTSATTLGNSSISDNGTTVTFSESITLATGTTALAPIMLQSGANLTAATAGAVEWNGTTLYVTNSTPTRNAVAWNPTTTLGDTIFASATASPGTLNRLAGNTSATMAVMTQTGTGTVSASPVWVTTTGTAGAVVLSQSPTLTGVVTLTASGAGTPAVLSGLAYQSYGTVTSWLQNNVQNLSNNVAASSDWVATADTGTDSTNYIDMGINSSGYAQGTWTINGALDGYLYTQSSNIAVGTATAGKNVVLFTGGTLAANARLMLSDTVATFSGLMTTLGFGTGVQSIVTAAGTTTLTVASPYQTIFTGTLTQICVLPAANVAPMAAGVQYLINNNSTGLITVQTNGGATLWTLAAGTQVLLTCLTTGTAAGTWEVSYIVGVGATGKSLTVNNTMIFAGTDATTLTFPSTSSYIASNPMTTTGDIMYASSTATPSAIQRLGIGATNSVLTVASGIPAWSSSLTLSGLTLSGFSTGTLINTSGVVSSLSASGTNLVLGNGNTIAQSTFQAASTRLASIAALADPTGSGFVLQNVGGTYSWVSLSGGAAAYYTSTSIISTPASATAVNIIPGATAFTVVDQAIGLGIQIKGSGIIKWAVLTDYVTWLISDGATQVATFTTVGTDFPINGSTAATGTNYHWELDATLTTQSGSTTAVVVLNGTLRVFDLYTEVIVNLNEASAATVNVTGTNLLAMTVAWTAYTTNDLFSVNELHIDRLP